MDRTIHPRPRRPIGSSHVEDDDSIDDGPDQDSDLIFHPDCKHKPQVFSKISSLKDIVGQTVMDILENNTSNRSSLFGCNDQGSVEKCPSMATVAPSAVVAATDMTPSTLQDLISIDSEFMNMLFDPSLINLPVSRSSSSSSSSSSSPVPSIPRSLEVKLPVDLSYNELAYFEYYCKKILPDLSILPQEFNYYSKIYIPLAFKEKAVLYTLVGWGCRMRKNRNLSYQVQNPEADGYMNLVNRIILKNNSLLDKEKFITNFVCYMLFVCMEISYGDTLRWSQYFTCCFKMINRMPGNFKYLLNECSVEGTLLAENFAYFDVLASQSNENGTFFPIADYRELFSFSRNIHDPLQGCIRPVILLIGEIVSLLVESSALNVSLDLSECDKYEMASKMMERSSELDNEIKFARPDLTCLQYPKSHDELEYHLTLFEVYQLSAQIYLREVIRKLPPIVPEMEVLGYNLREDLKILVQYKQLQKSLAFPMLLLGTSSTVKSDREDVKRMFETLIQNCGYLSSYQKLWIVVQKIWELNKDGSLYVDWFKVTGQFGWRLNLGR
ncbi:hypothetical protein FOA43_002530 [Brettanomyces nanus]|uniref:Uncharacterized protein n=1 Tax=Eeniella nana TaxID=13502 RepID=A0A875S074_EENNA|nr:uncharacterized protein FOA43_002530 [Brettanomyces nanus]QPG75181.1 hypothetical protein FOA43_002530 [Brettanomyces nanus]